MDMGLLRKGEGCIESGGRRCEQGGEWNLLDSFQGLGRQTTLVLAADQDDGRDGRVHT
jgi:hypothetical protein